ncbi:MAG: hypothetical protein Q7U38_20095 [Methylobacter sp.]|nr:hypothetical protein [Methylobacter sp.]MDP2100774.1 hypothetical protein [Methylobacter sp.]MDP2427045.1 hypothetical protein [Methylobacter sp.]MDP3053023.1 hypothetical protein [Methylobacter sp.]MDP3362902.1 hypothetical protein [Methylobacter sp.]
MLTTLRKFTVIFLAIVQLIAPLVHAHTGEESQGLGLHVPGLEGYGAKPGALTVQAQHPHFSADGIMVGIDTGIQYKQVNADVTGSPYLPQQIPLVNAVTFAFDVNFSPQPQQFVARLLIPALSPRAPPAHSFHHLFRLR